MTLSIHNLTYRIERHQLIEGLSLEFEPGLLHGILGPNGAGKSTLLKCLSRIWAPSEGKIRWLGQDLSLCSRPELSRVLSLVPQNPQLYFDFNVYDMVAMGRYSRGTRTALARKKIEESLRQVNGWHLREQMISQLSGGERQRIYIARALATEAPILLLDEPTSHLDLRHQLEIWNHLRSIALQGKLVITAIHDISAARRFCDKLIILQEGRCIATGSYEQVMIPELLRTVFGVEALETPEDYQLIP